MSGDLGTSIILTMAPIFVLMIGLVVYGIVKNSSKNKGQSRHESNAIIEAQAMLAKYQKEQAEKNANKEAEKKPEEKPEQKTEPKGEDKPKNDEKDEQKSEKPEKTTKPSAEAPISDTTELEPDIDKTEDE